MHVCMYVCMYVCVYIYSTVQKEGVGNTHGRNLTNNF